MKTACRIPRPLLAALIPTLVPLPPAVAQTAVAPPPPVSSAANEEALVLSPFEVVSAKDTAYFADRTAMGGRLATELRDTPASISVITREFMEDVGAYNITDAAAWVPNATSEYELQGENQFNDYNIRSRSLSTSAQSRNFVQWAVNGDSYNTERVDFARGPNAVVFGSADIGGIANVSTKAANSRRKAEATLLTTSFGGYRSTLDVNQPVNRHWFLRLNALSERLDGWRDYERRDRDGVTLNTTVNLGKKVSLNAEYEWGEINRIIVGRGVFDGYSNWDGVAAVNAPQTSGTFAGGIGRRGNDYLVYAPGSGQQILNWRNFGSTSGQTAQIMPFARPELHPGRTDVVIRDHAYHFFAPNTEARNPYDTYAFTLNARPVNNLFFEAFYTRNTYERYVDQLVWQAVAMEVNRVRPDGSANPYFGQLYADSRTRQQNQFGGGEEMRASLAYILKTKPTEQRLLVIGGRSESDYEQVETEFVRVSNTATPAFNNAVNYVYNRRYAGLRGEDWGVPNVAATEARWYLANNYTNRSQRDYLQLAASGSWFQSQKLSTVFGVRRETSKAWSTSPVLNTVTREVTGLTAETRSDSGISRRATRYSAGAVYHLANWLSLYSNYSESGGAQGTATKIDGSALAATVNVGLEGGARVSLFKNRLRLNVTRYVNTKENIRSGGVAGDINAIWDDLGLAARRVPTNYQDLSDTQGKGWELEVGGTPLPGLNLTGNLSYPQAYLTNGYGDTRAYYQANIADWRSRAAALADETVRTRVVQNIADVEAYVNGFASGQPIAGSMRYTANLYANYRFQGERLKGFWVGLGANLRGRAMPTFGGAVDPVTGRTYWREGYSTVSGGIGWEGKLWKMRTRLQLNATNLLDDVINNPTRYQEYTVAGQRVYTVRNYQVLDPRKLQFTARFGF